MADKVTATPAALALVASLQARHGPLLFLQAGGCCDNGAPSCLLPHEVTPGPGEVRLGEVAGHPFYLAASQLPLWDGVQLVLDVVDGDSGNLSLESGSGQGPVHTVLASANELKTAPI